MQLLRLRCDVCASPDWTACAPGTEQDDALRVWCGRCHPLIQSGLESTIEEGLIMSRCPEMIKPEAALQVQVAKFARECVTVPHFFFAMDRAKPAGPRTHMHEKMRGIRAGQPDTCLLVLNLSAIFVEMKSGKGRPTEQQVAVGDAIKRTRHIWDWTNSVEGYAAILARAGVPLSSDAQRKAMHADALLAAAAIRREEARTGAVSRKRYAAPEDKPTASKLRKVRALQASGVRV